MKSFSSAVANRGIIDGGKSPLPPNVCHYSRCTSEQIKQTINNLLA